MRRKKDGESRENKNNIETVTDISSLSKCRIITVN